MHLNIRSIRRFASLLAITLSGCGDDIAPQLDAGSGSSDSASIESDGSSEGAAPTVTFHRDIRPLVDRHCASCHTPGNIAPFALQTYDEVFAVRESVLAEVEAQTMPPWGMDPNCSNFVGDPSLDDDQRAMFATWLAEGAVEGDPTDFAPSTPIALPQLSRVDLTLQIPEPYTPVLMPDEYRCFVLEWPEPQTAFVTGLQFEPDNDSMSHHAIAYIVAPEDVAQFEALDDAEPGPGYTCFGGPRGPEPLDFITNRWLGAWAPGTFVGDLPEGTGLRIEPGSKVVMQMHYNTLAADGKPDQSRMHYRLASSVQREAMMLPWADPEWLAGQMPIPAQSPATVHTFGLDPTSVIDLLTDAIPSGVPLEFFTAMHHMHKRGTRGIHTLVRADGSGECLLSVPHYDFDWQHDYRRTEPVIVNPGDSVHVECEWDNAGNDRDVNWGDGTDDEMCLGIYYVTAAD